MAPGGSSTANVRISIFYSHLGVLAYLPEIAGLWIAKGTAYSFGYSQALVAAFLGGWAFWLAHRRMADVPTILFTLATVLVSVAPFAPGFPPLFFGPGMIYNRWGYALLALIFLEAFGGRKMLTASDELWGGVSTGALLALAFFLKITISVAAVFLVATLLPQRPQVRVRWTGIVIGLVALSVPFALYYRLQFGPMIHDLIMIGRAKHIPWRTYQLDEMVESVALVLALAGIASLFSAMRDSYRSALSILLAGIGVSLVGVAMLIGDHEYNRFPLAAFFAIAVCDKTENSAIAPVSAELRACVLIVGFASMVALFAGGLMSVSYGVLARVRGEAHSAKLAPPVWRGFSFTRTTGRTPISSMMALY